MARRSSPSTDVASLRRHAADLLAAFEEKLAEADLREKVRSLVPVFHALRDLGASLLPAGEASSGRERILAYLKRYATQVVDGDELLVVSGIDDWARRVRELRVEHGWWIYSGATLRDIADEDIDVRELQALSRQIQTNPLLVRPDQYVLMSTEQDRDAAHRWNTLNEIRKTKVSVSDKLLAYFRRNIGRQITGEELKYLAGDKSEWARRTRELRTEEGWPVRTKNSGRPDLPVGVYVMEADRQAPPHDRAIPDLVRVEVLQRDHFSCLVPNCGWNRKMLDKDDPRTMLELHHVVHHVAGGENTSGNLVTLCNVHHDAVHAGSLAIDPEWIR